jgi:hypothetical protein
LVEFVLNLICETDLKYDLKLKEFFFCEIEWALGWPGGPMAQHGPCKSDHVVPGLRLMPDGLA